MLFKLLLFALPLKISVLFLVHAFSAVAVAFSVIGCAALGAYHDIVFFKKTAAAHGALLTDKIFVHFNFLCALKIYLKYYITFYRKIQAVLATAMIFR